MASSPILPWFGRLTQLVRPGQTAERPDLHTLGAHPELWPAFVQASAVARRYLDLLSPLAWDRFPERNLAWQPTPVPYAALAAACLIKLDQQLVSMGRLRRYLLDNPALIWLCGFPGQPAPGHPCGFDPDASLPTARHLTRMLRELPADALQFLLTSSIALLQAELASCGVRLGECISVDTKHILAWVKENNPKAYVSDRYDKNQQPKGDPDCKLGCKRRHNRRAPGTDGLATPPTPAHNPRAATTVAVGEFYWGYASGVVATKVPDWGEFVLAELTQPFNQPDVSYFEPLLTAAEQRLGFRPPYAAFDAAFDAFYIYEYFDQSLNDAPDAPPASRRSRFRSGVATSCASLATGGPCVRPICPCRRATRSVTRRPASSTTAFATPVRSVGLNLPPKPAPSTTNNGPRAAARPRFRPVAVPVCATNSTAKARPTRMSTSNARRPNGLTAKPCNWASNAPACATGRPSPT